MTRRSADTPYVRIKDSATQALLIYAQLQQVTVFQSKIPGFSSGKVIHSQPPWNAAVAFSYLELHSLSRDLEDKFRYYSDQPARGRGGSDENTRLALESVINHTESVPESAVLSAIRDLESWIRRARIVLGELELPQRLPRLPGQAEPSCPFCKRRTLRMLPLRGVVTCIMPLSICKDDEGRKAFAKMEFSAFTQDFELVWQDDVVGIPAA